MRARLRAAIQRRIFLIYVAILRWRTSQIDRQYVDLGRDLDFCERAMAEARSRTHLRRLALLMHRKKLSARIARLVALK